MQDGDSSEETADAPQEGFDQPRFEQEEVVRAEHSLLEQAQTLLRQQQAELDDARERWKGERERSELNLQAREAELERHASRTESSRVELDSLRETIERERGAVEAERARNEKLAAEIEEQRAGVELRAGIVAQETADLERQRVEMTRVREELDSLREVLRRERETVEAERSQHEQSAAEKKKQRLVEASQADEVTQKLAELERQRGEIALARKECDLLRETVVKEREAAEADRIRCEQLAAEIEGQRAETERQLETVAQEAVELRIEKESFAEEQQKWEVAQSHARKQIEQRAEQLDRQREVLEEQKQSLATTQEEWEALKAEAEAKLAARAEQLDARERELDERTVELERIPRTANSGFGPSCSGDLEFLDNTEETDRPGRSVNSVDLFKEMRLAAPTGTVPLSEFSELRKLLKDDGSVPESADSEPGPVMHEREEEENAHPSVSEILLADPVIADSFVPQPSERRSVPSRPENGPMVEDDQEESIEQYMAGLMARVNNGSTPSSHVPTAERNVRTSNRRTSVPSAREDLPGISGLRDETPEVSWPVPAENKPVQVEDSSPRARAPERKVDLVTLRELANLSAQSALDTHARSRLMRSARAKLAVVTVALATAGILFYRWSTSPGSPMYYYIGLAVVLVAIFWGVQYVALAGYACLTGGRRTPRGKEAVELENAILEPDGLGGETCEAGQVEVVHDDVRGSSDDTSAEIV